jgi:hypothetical protein
MMECHKEKSQELLDAAEAVVGQNRAKFGVVATGDSFVGKREDGERINRQFGAIAVEMEGGSVAQSCLVNMVDFCIVRVVSDSIYKNSAANYNEFSDSAAEKSVQVVCEFLKAHIAEEREDEMTQMEIYEEIYGPLCPHQEDHNVPCYDRMNQAYRNDNKKRPIVHSDNGRFDDEESQCCDEMQGEFMNHCGFDEEAKKRWCPFETS